MSETGSNPLVIYHGGCADGFTAAWAVRKAIPDAELYAGVYQNAPPPCASRHVVMVDFSFKRPVIEQIVRMARSVLILDHHKSAADDLAGFPRPIMTSWAAHIDDNGQDGVDPRLPRVEFDMERSGAGLAWDFFHPGIKRPLLIDFVEDRDLWRFSLPRSREVNAYIFAHPYDLSIWDRLAFDIENDPVACANMGEAIERKHQKDVAELVAENRRELIIGGHWVPVCSLPKTLTSDAGHLMCAPYPSPNLHGEIVTPPFAACYWDTPAGRVFSLRSRDGGMDVAEIAKLYGGGGHRNAAGFRVPYGKLTTEGAPVQ